MESMGVASGCGCKEIYRFPHTTVGVKKSSHISSVQRDGQYCAVSVPI